MTTATETRSTRAKNESIDLDAIAALSDPVRVLSVYVDADPALAAGPHPAWQAPVRAGLRRLAKDARRALPSAEWAAVSARLDELEPELEALLDPRLGRRGRALFSTVDGGEVHRVDLPVPLVALERHARVLPLLAVVQGGGPAGAATLSRGRLTAGEWQFGLLSPLETIEFAAAELRQSRPATNPAVRQPFPERDRFESAAGARILSLLRDAGERLARHAVARGWDVLVVDGDARLVEPLSDSFRTDSCRLVRSPHPITELDDAAAADRVGSTVRALRAGRVAELVGALDASSASTRDPLVLERSLEEGRVQHLLITVSSEPFSQRSAESLLRRALETGADVTIVPPEAANLGVGGAAALLRW